MKISPDISEPEGNQLREESSDDTLDDSFDDSLELLSGLWSDLFDFQNYFDLYCQRCDIEFTKYGDFHIHTLKHVELPTVSVERLSGAFINKHLAGKVQLRSIAVKHTRPSGGSPSTARHSGTVKLGKKAYSSKYKHFNMEEHQDGMEEHSESNNFMPDHSDASNDNEDFETVDNLKEEDDIDQENYENFGEESPGQSQSPKSLSNVNEDRNSGDDSTVPHSPAYSPPPDDNEEYAEEDGMSEVEGMLEDDGENGENDEGVHATNEDGIDENDAGNAEDDGDAHMDEDEGIDDEELSEHKSPNEEDQNVNESESSAYHSASPRSPSQSDVNDSAEDRNDDNRPQQSSSEFMPAPINDNSQHTNFSWHDENDPGGDQNISVTEFKVEEIDPLMLAEQDSADTHAEIESSLEDMLGNSAQSSGRAAVNSHNGSEFNMVTAESLGLASEFISIEHLDKSNAFRCEVCGERCNSSDSLESHRSQLGHYKCNHESCGGVVCGTAQELSTHKETAHADSTYEQNSGPVQQLVQQVMGLPTPPQENNQQNSLSQVSITSLPQVSISPLPSGQVSISPISLPQVSFSPAQQQPHVPSIQPRPINSLMNQQPNSKQSSIIRLPQGVTIQPQGSTQGNSQKRSITTPPPVNHATKQPRLMEALLSNQDDDPDCEVISVTKNVAPSSRHSQNAQMNNVPPKGRSDAKAVANILATRGITVTPSGTTGSNKVAPPNMQKQTPIAQLNLNSAISIMPTTDRSNNPSGNFAVPQGRGPVQRQHHQQIDRPMRPPTVDLTKDTPVQPMRMQPQPQPYMARGRARGRGPTMPVRHTCHLCDKAFTTAESLSQHLLLHRSPNKLAYRCNQCNAQYSTQQALIQHRQSHHKEMASSVQAGSELGIPVVDFKLPATLNRMQSLGIRHYIPLSQFMRQGHNIGLPLIAVDGARLPSIATGVGASAILSLGPLRNIPR